MMRTRYAMPNTRALMGLGGGMSEQDAYDREMDRLTRMDVARSTIGANDARAESERGKLALEQQMQAAALEARRARGDSGTQQRMLMLRDPTIPPEAARAHVRRAEGGPFEAPQYANPDQARLAGETLAGLFASSFADKETGGKDMADVVFNAGSSAQRLRAPELAASDPVTAAFMLNAGVGKDAPALYGAMPGGLGTFGTLTGKMNINQPLQQSVIGENNAQAGSSWASARASDALAAQRDRTTPGAPMAPSGAGVVGRAPIGYRWGPDGETLEPIPGGPADKPGAGGQERPLPATALRMQQEELEGIALASNLDKDLGAIDEQLASGKLELGLVENFRSDMRNWTGLPSENSTNYASFLATLKKLQNDSLRLNKGVQTEGDAVRAWDELIKNPTDVNLVRQRLAEIRAINQRAVAERQFKIDAIRRNYGAGPLDTTQLRNAPAAIGARPGEAAPAPSIYDGMRWPDGRVITPTGILRPGDPGWYPEGRQPPAPVPAAPRPGGATGTWGEPMRLDVNGATPPQDAVAGVPKVGDVVDGYRFKGGDPADPANWEPVR